MADTAMDTSTADHEAVSSTPAAATPAVAPSPDAAPAQNGLAEAAATPAAPDPVAAPPPPANPLLEKYNIQWETVKADDSDFTTWTQLIATAEKLDDLGKVCAVYDTFLSLYPLCYGYWKKYADAQNKYGHTEAAVQVYERGVSSVPYSVDLWGYYATYKQNVAEPNHEDVRSVYERGLAYVGADYLAHGLWDKYLSFEAAHGTSLHLSRLYSQVLGCPIKELDRMYTGFKTYVTGKTAAELLVPEQLEALRAQLQQARDAEAAATASTAAAAAAAATATAAAATPEAKPAGEDAVMSEAANGVKEEEGAKEGDGVKEDVKAEAAASEAAVVAAGDGADAAAESKDAMDVDATAAGGAAAAAPAADAAATTTSVPAAAASTPPAAAAPTAPAVAPVTDSEIRASWLSAQEQLYRATKVQLAERKPFEDAVRRPYFHVKPLDAAQLNNWWKYLDWAESKQQQPEVLTLYERCLVPCALYPDMWQRYVRYLEATGAAEHASAALARATQVFCKRRPEIHIFAARFHERHGALDAARAAYKALLSDVAPGLLPAVVAAANFERRHGDRDAACRLYDALLAAEAGAAGGGSSGSSGTYEFVCIQYAHFLKQAYDEIAKARQVLTDALETCPGSRALWEAAIFFEEGVPGADRAARVLRLYDQCTAPPPAATATAGAEDGAEAQQDKPRLSDKDREELSLRGIDAADQLGGPEQVLEAERRHAARFSLQAGSSSADSRKRGATDAAGGAAKQAKTDTAAAAVAAATAVSAPAMTAPLGPGALPPAPPVPPVMPGGYYPPAAPVPAAAPAPYPYPGYGYQQYPGYPGYYPGY